MKQIFNRIYNDYFMKSRLDEYEQLLKKFLNNNYQFIMIKDYDKMNKNGKYIIIRHDIDSDLKIAKKMFEIEKKLNIKSTFYFRLSTFDNKLIEDINKYGSEVGYHFEEIANFCKENKNISSSFVFDNLDEIKKTFINNVKKFENETNSKLYSVAAHGDFVNRKINVYNSILMDEKVRKDINVDIEAYDIEKHLDFRTCDCMYPKFWLTDPNTAIKEDKKKVLLLVHTRWWDKSPLIRFKNDFIRLVESVRYK